MIFSPLWARDMAFYTLDKARKKEFLAYIIGSDQSSLTLKTFLKANYKDLLL